VVSYIASELDLVRWLPVQIRRNHLSSGPSCVYRANWGYGCVDGSAARQQGKYPVAAYTVSPRRDGH
jgi:hypothetical protein